MKRIMYRPISLRVFSVTMALMVMALLTASSTLWPASAQQMPSYPAGFQPEATTDEIAASQGVTLPEALDPGDEAWDERFGLPGVDGVVEAIAIVGPNVYVGGTFTTAGSGTARNIARWDGTRWYPVGTGVNNTVHALATDGTNLYAGGYFTEAGGVSVGRVARWDGSQWRPLGSGVDLTVFSLEFVDGNLYVGGEFNVAGGVPVGKIARWDGTQWHPLDSGTNGLVWAIEANGTDLYVGGSFNEAGGNAANYVARWDGSQWSPLGSGVDANVYALAWGQDGLYTGGAFGNAGGQAAGRVARWDGAQWQPLGSGVTGGNPVTVEALEVDGNAVYAGGRFTFAGGVPAGYVAKWQAGAWSALGGGVGMNRGATSFLLVAALAVSGTELFAGGEFTSAGSVGANRVARWTGSAWGPLNSGMNGGAGEAVFALARDGSDLYVGGFLGYAGDVVVNGIARWDGNQWHALGSGVNARVHAIAIFNGDVYIGGEFTQAGGGPALRVARWDGSQWHPVGSGMNNTVYALTVMGGELFAGGQFTDPGAFVAKWNGTFWQPLSAGTNGFVQALGVGGGNIYAGGTFSQAGGAPANNIARWDGTQWHRLGSGTNNTVSAIATSGSDVYVGGWFESAGGTSARKIARWDGNQWYNVGGGMSFSDSGVYDIAVGPGAIYATGGFGGAGNVEAFSIAKWDGVNWSNLGSGLARRGDLASGRALVLMGDQLDELYVGGFFTRAGGKLSNFIGLWHEDLAATPTPTYTVTASPTPSRTPTPIPSCTSSFARVASPNGAPGDNFLSDVASVSSNDVWAVGGYYMANGHYKTLTMHWNGIAWSIVPSPNTTGRFNSLTAVTAISANDVWAVGYSTDEYYVSRSLTMRWNGAAWSIVPSPNPGDRFTVLSDVAAAASNDVWAVGHHSLGSTSIKRSLAMRWNGTAWNPVLTNDPPSGEHDFLLTGVTAISANDAWAVGYSVRPPGEPDVTYIKHWDGAGWSTVQSANVQYADSYLLAVSGSASNNVWAVGYYNSGGTRRGFIQRWDGAQWSIIPTPNPQIARDVYLHDIVVVSASEAWAVGYHTVLDNPNRALLMRWDGSMWAIVDTGFLTARASELAGVDIVGPGQVWAIGARRDWTTSETLTARLLSGNWTVTPSPNSGEASSSLSGISALSQDDAWAVGANSGRTLTLHWDGSAWTQVPSPSTSYGSNALNDVVARAPDDVWAVGSHNVSQAYNLGTLTMRWNGAVWSIVPSPNPGGWTNVLNGVEAVSQNEAWAVGYKSVDAGSQTEPLILRWNGTAWSAVPYPGQGSFSGKLESVSATSATDVWTVGHRYLGGSLFETLIMRWNGTAWSIVPSPNPAQNEPNYLFSVSALAPNDAWAVGYYRSVQYNLFVWLTMRWNGSAWVVVEGQEPPTQRAGRLFDVDVRTPNDAWAVGDAGQGSEGIITVRWNGVEWIRVRTEPLPVSSVNALTGVAAISPVEAWAVGQQGDNYSSSASTLALRYVDECPQSCTPHIYSDVPPGHTFYPFVTCLSQRGVLSGYGDCTFRPGNDITRGQVAKVVSNAAGYNDDVTGRRTFADVPSTHTFWLWVERLTLHNVMGGYPCGGEGEPCDPQNRPYFRPQSNATRGQISKIVANAAGIQDPVSGQFYADVSPSHTFYLEIMRLTGRGVMSGYECGQVPQEPCDSQNRPYFRPGNNVTRGQGSKIVANTFFPNCQSP